FPPKPWKCGCTAAGRSWRNCCGVRNKGGNKKEKDCLTNLSKCARMRNTIDERRDETCITQHIEEIRIIYGLITPGIV
ncbi:MAG: hypothetical protein K2O73_01625, partial [Lachnospiraceae bacterium]|nr:hypothetical protein [Lachnospiraceae bacterium]